MSVIEALCAELVEASKSPVFLFYCLIISAMYQASFRFVKFNVFVY
jgi:cell division protein FtsL